TCSAHGRQQLLGVPSAHTRSAEAPFDTPPRPRLPARFMNHKIDSSIRIPMSRDRIPSADPVAENGSETDPASRTPGRVYACCLCAAPATGPCRSDGHGQPRGPWDDRRARTSAGARRIGHLLAPRPLADARTPRDGWRLEPDAARQRLPAVHLAGE